MIKCACSGNKVILIGKEGKKNPMYLDENKDETCEIEFPISGNTIRFIGKDGNESLMYLDANRLVELIKEARDSLRKMTNSSEQLEEL